MNIKRYMDLAASLGCWACRKDGYPGTPAQLHHPRAKAGMGERGADDEVIPLCPTHHVGPGGLYPNGEYFPSIHGNAKAFRRRYGEDAALSAEVRAAVEELERSFV